MAFHSRNFLTSVIIVLITLSFLIDKFQDTTNNLFLLETSSQSQQDAIELFEKYFKQEQEQPSMDLAVRPHSPVILPDVLYELFSDEFLDQYWQKFAVANHEPAPLIF
ncbi:hypothetical protein C1645_739358 [Glomus cerebriforme]|uniref:Uncharacterized protein n=1 Tax=Glomus cerebriforme TaxID=658196 RepID=A0A397SU92_9GLOM|nr:hypothetical protein C1645_739358 [Glomus cerebriforme]